MATQTPSVNLTETTIESFVKVAAMTSDAILKDMTKKNINDPVIIKTLTIVERYIRKRKLVVYGGTAINSILPSELQFYDPEYDLPDWDFYSDDPVIDGMNIADQVYKDTEGAVSLTTAVHEGTYKVYADGLAIADITNIDRKILEEFRKNAIEIDGIYYSGPNFLRMAAYLELSRPNGQPDRWEKVMRRVTLLNKAYPINISLKTAVKSLEEEEPNEYIKEKTIESLIELQQRYNELFAFIGGFGVQVLRKTLFKRSREGITIPEIGENEILTIVSSDPESFIPKFIKIMVNQFSAELEDIDISQFTTETIETYVEYLGKYTKIFFKPRDGRRKNILLGVVLETTRSCQSILKIKIKNQPSITIGSIESMLYLLLALLFVPEEYDKDFPFKKEEIMTYTDFLIRLHYRVLITQKKPLIPLPKECIGQQLTIQKMRTEKNEDIRRIIRKMGKQSADYFLRNIRYDAGDKKTRRLVEKALIKVEEVK
jgi:hypothetical protein